MGRIEAVDKPFEWIVELEPVVSIDWCKTKIMQGLGCSAQDHLQQTRRVPRSKANVLYQV